MIDTYLTYLQESKEEFLYRYVDKFNRGIMSDYYYPLKGSTKIPIEVFNKLSWLPKPPKWYNKNHISYFTELGNSKFLKTNYKEFKKYIPDIKVVKVNIKDINKILYKDKYQIVTKRD